MLLFELFCVRARRKASSFSNPDFSVLVPIEFPLMSSTQHMGFVNSKQNDAGMRAEFFIGPKTTAYCRWQNSNDRFEGFSGIVHGGILVALADELMANVIVAHQKKFAVSVRASVQWHRPAMVGSAVFGFSEIRSCWKHFVSLAFTLQNAEGEVLLSGSGLFYLPNTKQFQKITGRSLPVELINYLRK
jgi:uncharacterized protein (TIGR00369 family)